MGASGQLADKESAQGDANNKTENPMEPETVTN